MSGYLDWMKGVRDANLPPTAKLTAFVLATYMDFDTGECFVLRSTVAEKIRASVSTVSRSVRRLEDDGWIEKRQRFNAANVYRRKMPDDAHEWWLDNEPFDPSDPF